MFLGVVALRYQYQNGVPQLQHNSQSSLTTLLTFFYFLLMMLMMHQEYCAMLGLKNTNKNCETRILK